MKKLLLSCALFLVMLSVSPLTLQAQEAEEPPLTFVEQMPQFQGDDLYQYLGKKIKYPEDARLNKQTGKVIIQFIIEKDGTLSHIELLKSSGVKSLDEEALRVVKAMPPWTPGKQNGKLVRTIYTLPISFQLN